MNTVNLSDPFLTALRILTPAVCLVWLAFVGRYSVRTWWRSLEGQHLMVMALLLSGTFFLATLMPWLDLSTRSKLVISCIVYAAIGGIGLHRHWLLSRADRQARADKLAELQAEEQARSDAEHLEALDEARSGHRAP